MCEMPWGIRGENSAPVKYRGHYKTEQKLHQVTNRPGCQKKLCRLRVGTGRRARQSPPLG